MLQHLFIKNYTLIDTLDIDFHAGFSVITGETGAGKSIILGALGLLLGKRADVQAIKQGESKCTVEGSFDISQRDFGKFFRENDLDEENGTCLLRREITANGKSRSFINDTPVTLGVLRQMGLLLIDIHSQHQNLLLGNPDFVIDIVDAYAGNADLRKQYETSHTHYVELKASYQKEKREVEKKKQEFEFLQFQLQQLTEARLCEGEQTDLESEQNVLTHAEELKSQFYTAASLLDGGTEGEGVLSALKQAGQSLSSISDFHAAAGQLSERVESCLIELRDIDDELNRLQEDTIFDAARLQEVEDRLNVIYTLQQKFRVDSVKALLALQQKLEAEVQAIENSDETLQQLQKATEEARVGLLEVGHQLSRQRQKACSSIEKQLLQLLQHLGLPNAALQFAFTESEEPLTTGLDQIVFLFSSNKTLQMQEADKIASGGEIARLMLSLKTVVSTKAQLPTIIFDEIDTGVSGKIADKMAATMQQLSEHCQVVSITHLPQIASMGSHHYKVYKQDQAHGVSTHIVELSAQERVTEIANMLSGSTLTDAALSNAKELLKKSEK